MFEALEKEDYLSDTMVAKIWGSEPNWTTAEEYKRQWRKLQNDRNFFEDKKIVSVSKHRRMHLAELDNGETYKIGEDFYKEINNKLNEK